MCFFYIPSPGKLLWEFHYDKERPAVYTLWRGMFLTHCSVVTKLKVTACLPDVCSVSILPDHLQTSSSQYYSIETRPLLNKFHKSKSRDSLCCTESAASKTCKPRGVMRSTYMCLCRLSIRKRSMLIFHNILSFYVQCCTPQGDCTPTVSKDRPPVTSCLSTLLTPPHC